MNLGHIPNLVLPKGISEEKKDLTKVLQQGWRHDNGKAGHAYTMLSPRGSYFVVCQWD
jgi:hypothetical protein